MARATGDRVVYACVSRIKTQAHPPTPQHSTSPNSFAASSPPPLGRAVGHARVAGAVREAPYGLIPAENEIHCASIGRAFAHRPAALALSEIKKRTALGAVDRSRLADRAVHGDRRVGRDQPQHLPL